MKNTPIEENGDSSKLACYSPCYRLIPLNKLRVTGSISTSPKMKKNSLFYQAEQAPAKAGLETAFFVISTVGDIWVEGWSTSSETDLSPAEKRGQDDKGGLPPGLAFQSQWMARCGSTHP